MAAPSGPSPSQQDVVDSRLSEFHDGPQSPLVPEMEFHQNLLTQVILHRPGGGQNLGLFALIHRPCCGQESHAAVLEGGGLVMSDWWGRTEAGHGDVVLRGPIQIFNQAGASLVDLLDVSREPSVTTRGDALHSLPFPIASLLQAPPCCGRVMEMSSLLHDLWGGWAAEIRNLDIREEHTSRDDFSIESSVYSAANDDATVTGAVRFERVLDVHDHPFKEQIRGGGGQGLPRSEEVEVLGTEDCFVVPCGGEGGGSEGGEKGVLVSSPILSWEMQALSYSISTASALSACLRCLISRICLAFCALLSRCDCSFRTSRR
jgi:hypothetical protein